MPATVLNFDDYRPTTRIPVIEGEVADPYETTRIPIWRPLPPVPPASAVHTTRVERRSLRKTLARRWRLFRRSQLAADLHTRRGLVILPALLLTVAGLIALVTGTAAS